MAWQGAVHWTSSTHPLTRAIVPLAALSLALLALLIVAEGSGASPYPPANGDWTIGMGESVHHDNVTLDLRGSLRVIGTLELDDCTLWVWLASGSPRSITVAPGGELLLTRTAVGPVGATGAYYVEAQPGSRLDLLEASFWRAGHVLTGDGRMAGVHVAGDATILRASFQDCLVGLWAEAGAGETLVVRDSGFLQCRYGVVASGRGSLELSGGDILGCTIGALCNGSTMTVSGVTAFGGEECILAYGGRLVADNCEVYDFTVNGVGVFDAIFTVRNCTIHDADADGMVVHSSKGEVWDCTFRNLTADVKAVHTDLRLGGTTHHDTYDEALWMYHSTFNLSNVTTLDAYWGLRGFRSSGALRGLSSFNATIAIILDRCTDVLLEDLYIDGGVSKQRPSVRAVYITGGPFTIRRATVRNERTGIDLTSAIGTVEDSTVEDCTREGVLISLSWQYVVRNVTVRRCLDGFRLNMQSGGRLEGCNADSCRATGFNFTARSSGTLLECNASGNPIGMNVFYSSPVLVDCMMYQCTASGVPMNTTKGLVSLYSAPHVIGGTVVGGRGGIHLNESRALVRGVTFTLLDSWCIGVEFSTGDVIEGCTFINCTNATAIISYTSTPVVRGCTVQDLNYGFVSFRHSDMLIENCLIEDVRWDGIDVFEYSSATTRGNLVRRTGSYAIHVLYYSHLVSRDDVLRGAGDETVRVHVASTADIRGASFVNGTVGVYAFDCPWVIVSYSEFRDLNRGVVSYAAPEHKAETDVVTLTVEGCYFTNHSSYAVGAFEGVLTVVQCNFLDNIAAIMVRNATVRITDCTMVGSWLYGLEALDATVDWTVEDRCRLVSSDVIAPVIWRIKGASLHIEDTDVELSAPSGLSADPGSVVRIINVMWLADGAPFRVAGGVVELRDSRFVGVGPVTGGEAGGLGVSLSLCEALVVNCTFGQARTGLSMVGCQATLLGSTVVECSTFGLYVSDSRLDLQASSVNRTMVGTALHLLRSDMVAEALYISQAMRCIDAVGSAALVANSSLWRATVESVRAQDSHVRLVNTTHEASDVTVEMGGDVEVAWHLTVRVRWPNPEELSEAVVHVTDKRGDEVAGGGVDASGRLRDLEVLALVHRPGGSDAQGPHTVEAALSRYSKDLTVNLTASTVVVLDLEDTDPPYFRLFDPASDEVWTRHAVVRFQGEAIDDGAGVAIVVARLDYASTPWNGDMAFFNFSVTLTDGRHIVELIARDMGGNEAIHTVVLWVETRPLVMTPPEPADGTLTNRTYVTVTGRLSRVEGVTVRVNGALAELDVPNRSYFKQVQLNEGPNKMTIEVEDIYGHLTVANLTVIADRTPPSLRLTSSLEVNTSEQWVEISGSVDPDARLFLQSTMVLYDDGNFSVRYPIYVGETAIRVWAQDDAGNLVERWVIAYRWEEDDETERPSPWEIYPFILLTPLLMVGLYAFMRRRRMGGGPP